MTAEPKKVQPLVPAVNARIMGRLLIEAFRHVDGGKQS